MAEGTVNLYNPHNGLTGRDGGPYLDQEERRLAEIVRAAKEDREPDFENAPATAGTPLVDANTLVLIANPASNPSQSGTVDAMTNAVNLLADNEDFPATPHSQRDKTEAEKEAERLAASDNVHDNPANPTVISKDDKDTSEQTRQLASQDAPGDTDLKDSSKDDNKSDETVATDTTKDENKSTKKDDFGSPSDKSSTTKKAAAPVKTTAAKAPAKSPSSR